MAIAASSSASFDRPESDQALRNLGNLLKHLTRTLDGDGSRAAHHGLESRGLGSVYERRKLRAVSDSIVWIVIAERC
jgi:hypothetical protein